MNAREFARLVERMRAAQRRYFRDRAHTSLEESKRLEREVDSALREILDERPRLFGAEDPR